MRSQNRRQCPPLIRDPQLEELRERQQQREHLDLLKAKIEQVPVGTREIHYRYGEYTALYSLAPWQPLTTRIPITIGADSERAPLLRSPDRKAGLADIR